MGRTMKLFQIGLRQIAKDGMLFVLIPAPFIVGLAFRFGIPLTNRLAEDMFSFSFSPWYGLVDGFLVMLTPLFAAMIAAFLMLEERDEDIGAFYQITPVEGYAYLTARIGVPMLWAFVSSLAVLSLFRLSELSWSTILSSSVISTLTGISMSMMVVSFAANRVEGLALSKLMGISFLGLFIVWFAPAPYSFFASFLPSFWVGKVIMDGTHIIAFALGLLSCAIWIAFFTRKFMRRI